MEQPVPAHVTLYSRPGCHLCEQAAELLEELATRVPLALTEVNILSDPMLYERYKWSIPVVAIAGGSTFSAPLDSQALKTALITLNPKPETRNA